MGSRLRWGLSGVGLALVVASSSCGSVDSNGPGEEDSKPLSKKDLESLPDADRLRDSYLNGDAAAFSAAAEALLRAGARGADVALAAYRAVEERSEGADSPTEQAALLASLEALLAERSEGAARLGARLLALTAETPDARIRREVFVRVPGLMASSSGAHPELRAALQTHLVLQLRERGEWLEELDAAADAIGFTIPADAYLPGLLDPERATQHGIALRELASRGDDGLEVIQRFLDGTKVKHTRSVSAAVGHVIEMESAKPRSEPVEKLLASEHAFIRKQAFLNYFRFPRAAGEAPRVLSFLNGDAEDTFKTVFVRSLSRRNGDILLALEKDAAKIDNADLRLVVTRLAQTARKRR